MVFIIVMTKSIGKKGLIGNSYDVNIIIIIVDNNIFAFSKKIIIIDIIIEL